jgi:hypothetical protein
VQRMVAMTTTPSRTAHARPVGREEAGRHDKRTAKTRNPTNPVPKNLQNPLCTPSKRLEISPTPTIATKMTSRTIAVAGPLSVVLTGVHSPCARGQGVPRLP